MRRLKDRTEAGRMLAGLLTQYKDAPDCIVLALPRGGVVVAAEIARALHLPLDVLVVRKLGAPMQPELAIGAIAEGAQFLNQDVIDDLGVPPQEVEAEIAAEEIELRRRSALYRSGKPPLALAGRTVIVVDDGIATGATMGVALSVLRKQKVRHLVVAVAVGPPRTIRWLRKEADEVVCLMTPEPFVAISPWYLNFPQTEDDEVRALLAEAAHQPALTKGT